MPTTPPLEWKRATADHAGTCQPCNQPTNRIVAFREEGQPRWGATFICDSCLEGYAAMAAISRKPAEA